VFRQISILAPGLLGASLGKAAREAGLADSVVVYARRAETRKACRAEDWCAGSFDSPAAAVRESDAVFLCAPVEVIPGMMEAIHAAVGAGALVTDVGSVKAAICASGRAWLGNRFVGSHPMAGSEKGGLEHARADLFRDQPCFVTPGSESRADLVAQTVGFWEALGMRVTQVNPDQHDRIVANISHLPHLLASLLAAYLDGQPRDWARHAGNGLRDTTRVAAGNPGLWRAILELNNSAVLDALNGFETELAKAIADMKVKRFDSVEALLTKGQAYRNRL